MSFIPYQQTEKLFKRKKMCSDILNEVELSNRFNVLSDESMKEETTTDLPQDQNAIKEKPKKIPPIVVYGDVDKMESIVKMQKISRAS